jgi:N-acetylglutamate synthase-like GNAT family acetyltransferase
MKIRRLTLDDYDRVTELWSRAKLPFKPKGRDSRDAMATQMVATPDFFLGMYQDNDLIGVAILTCEGRKGWINRLAVDPDYRRHGVAKTLIAECEKTLRRHGVRLFCVLIDYDNSVSKELFKKCGYVEHHDILYFSKRDSDEI